jgi:hypothetical protein
LGKAKFTKHFQKNLENSLREFIKSKRQLEHLEVHSEYYLRFGGKKNQVTIIDIAIIDPNSKGYLKNKQPENIIAIEIEMFNNQEQIFKNYDYFKNYISGGSSRTGGLIMLFSDKAKINGSKLSDLFNRSKIDQKTVNGFKGAFHDLEIYDRRKNKQLANNLIQSDSFKKKLKEAVKHSLNIKFQ